MLNFHHKGPKRPKLITFAPLINLEFFTRAPKMRSWALKMSNKDPEGFLVGLRDIDPSISIEGFVFGENKKQIVTVAIHCTDLEGIMEFVTGRYEPRFSDFKLAEAAGIKMEDCYR